MAAVELRHAPSVNESVFALLEHSWHSRPLSSKRSTSGSESETRTSGAATEKESVLSLLDDSWFSSSVNLSSKTKRRGSESSSQTSGSVGASEPELISLLDQSWYSRSEKSGIESESERTRSADAEQVSGMAAAVVEQNSNTASGSEHFDEEEMRQVFEMFDADKDGVISVDEVRSYMSKLKFNLSEAETDHLMTTVDVNNDGTVDFDEFYSLYNNIRSSDKDTVNGERNEKDSEDEDDVLQAFHVFDSNNDGYITAVELQAVFQQLGLPEGKNLKSCQKMIENVNKNGTGKVDLNQFRQMMSSKLPQN